MERVTVWLARVGFLSIAACTFGLSFDAITDVARETGAVDPSLAWIVPLAVDGMIVTATAVLWTESLSGRGWHIFPLLAIVGPAALSMWANVAHASGQSLLAEVLAAVPPIGLILSLELVAWQIRRERNIPTHDLRRRARVASERWAPDITAPTHNDFFASAPTPESDPSPAPTPARPATADADGTATVRERTRTATARQAQVQAAPDDTGHLLLDLPQDNANSDTWRRIIAAVEESGAVPTQRELADELDVPRSRIKRAIDRNRDEWERLRQRVEEPASVGASDQR